MKELFTLVMSLFCLSLFSQTALFKSCPGGVIENAHGFARQPELVSGNDLTSGAVYRYNDFVESPFKMYVLVKIDTISNARLLVLDHSADDATSDDHSFRPRITPDLETLSGNRVGFVQFTLTFYNSASGTPVLLPEITFTNWDMDGHLTGSNGSFRETLWTSNDKGVTYSGAPQTEVAGLGSVLEGSKIWKKYLGATAENNDGAFLPETAIAMRFVSASSISLRMGYDFKYGGVSYSAPAYRQYASKLSCLNFLASGPLPLDLTSFSVAYRDQQVQLSWTTENETMHNHFEIQRSFTRQDFRTIAFVLGPRSLKGASNLYEYKDKSGDIPGNENIYYRLKQVAKDGSTTYSTTRQIDIGQKGSVPVLSPNPFQDKVEVRYNSPGAGEVGILIRNISGQVIERKQQLINKGVNRISVQGLARLPPGLYIIQILVNNSVMLHQKLLKN